MEISMKNLHGSAKGTSFEKTIEMLKNAELNGAAQYFTAYFLAKKFGFPNLAEAILDNAAEDGAHGGIYAHLLGEGPATEDEFIKLIISMYKAEAGARPILTKLANEVRESGEDNAEEIAALIEHSIPEEEKHAATLKAACERHGINID